MSETPAELYFRRVRETRRAYELAFPLLREIFAQFRQLLRSGDVNGALIVLDDLEPVITQQTESMLAGINAHHRDLMELMVMRYETYRRSAPSDGPSPWDDFFAAATSDLDG